MWKMGFRCAARRTLPLAGLCAGLCGCAQPVVDPDAPPPGFVLLGSQGDAPIRTEVRYFGRDNFVGEPIDGYEAPKIYVTRPVLDALLAAQRDLAPFGFSLKVFDAYRPQRAVDHFARWAADLDDTRMKSRYYPRVDKRNLFRDGYIAARSGHSRGSAVDVTLVDAAGGGELDMGSPWDFFDTASAPDSPQVTAAQRANRLLLRSVMLRSGFLPLAEEWWHFTLEDEPFPDTYFDFPVR